jgi:hypothetical protein
MKINFAYLLSAILAVGLVALGFTFFEISGERNRLKDELKNRSSLIAEEFNSNYLPRLSENNLNDRKNVSDSLTGYFNLLGIAVYYNKDQFVPLSPDIEPYLEYSTDYVLQSLNADSSFGNFFTVQGKNIYQL